MNYYMLNIKAKFLIGKEGYYSFYYKSDNWACETCAAVCKMKININSIAQTNETTIHPSSPIYKYIDYSTVSN